MDENISNLTISKPAMNAVAFGLSCLVSLTSLIGIGFTLINIAIFSNPLFKDKIYNYMKLESLFIIFDLLIISTSPFYHCRVDTYSKSLVYFINWKYFKIYATSLCEMCALMSGILASFVCVLVNFSVVVKFKAITELSACLVLLVSLMASGVLFLYQLFEYDIQRQIDGTFDLIETQFKHSYLNKVMQVISFSTRDGLLTIILVLLNTFMLHKTRQSLNNKSRMLQNSNSKTAKNGTGKDTTIKKSQKKLIKLLIFDALLYLLSRIPILVYFAIVNPIFNYSSEYLNLSLSLTVSLTFGSKFFFYYRFNKNFQKVFKQNKPKLYLFF